MKFELPPDPHGTIDSSDESDIGIRRQFKAMKARLNELEAMYASRFQYQVPTATVIRQASPRDRCKVHLHVEVSMHSSRVKCADCDVPLDPLQVLREFAREERQFAYRLEHLRQEKADLSKEIEALKKQKAALRSAVRKAGGTPVSSWQVKTGKTET